MEKLLVKEHKSEEKKVDMIRSLRAIIEFVGGAGIGDVKHKVISTLHTAALVLKDFNVIVRAWETLVRTLEPASVSPIVCQIVASLLRIYGEASNPIRDRVISLLKHLLIEKQDELRDQFRNLFFLPDRGDLREVNGAVRSGCRQPESMDVRDSLRFLLNSIDHDSVDVRSFTLKKLKTVSVVYRFFSSLVRRFRLKLTSVKVLETEKVSLQHLITASDVIDGIISMTIRALIKATRDTEAANVKLAGECLGRIGAIDPGRLGRNESAAPTANEAGVVLHVGEEQFAVDLLGVLVRSFIALSGSTDADSCGFSIQEVLKAYNINDRAALTTKEGRIWNALSDSTCEVLRPYLTSHYHLNFSGGENPSPLCRFGRCSTQIMWYSRYSSII